MPFAISGGVAGLLALAALIGGGTSIFNQWRAGKTGLKGMQMQLEAAQKAAGEQRKAEAMLLKKRGEQAQKFGQQAKRESIERLLLERMLSPDFGASAAAERAFNQATMLTAGTAPPQGVPFNNRIIQAAKATGAM